MIGNIRTTLLCALLGSGGGGEEGEGRLVWRVRATETSLGVPVN